MSHKASATVSLTVSLTFPRDFDPRSKCGHNVTAGITKLFTFAQEFHIKCQHHIAD
jgi:hypothetical protein